MAEMPPLFVLPLALLLCLCGAVCRELCYVDSSTGTGVYCDENCCGSSPVYCCDKDTFITKSAVFGSFAVLFLLILATCCFWKAQKRRKKKAALAATKRTAAPAVSGTAAAPAVFSVEDSVSPQKKAVPSGSRAAPSGSRVSPPPYSLSPAPAYRDRYNDNVYPPAATPVLPPAVH